MLRKKIAMVKKLNNLKVYWAPRKGNYDKRDYLQVHKDVIMVPKKK